MRWHASQIDVAVIETTPGRSIHWRGHQSCAGRPRIFIDHLFGAERLQRSAWVMWVTDS
jgi:hypothetical protein